MKEDPGMKKVYENMKPGVVSLHGFLGSDKRNIEQIVEHDLVTLGELGLTTETIADMLEKLRDKAFSGFGEWVDIGGGLLAKSDSIRGKLPCPFEHKGLYRKTVTSIRGEGLDKEVIYTDLGIHLVREHGFFQGKGSPFRLEPEQLFYIFEKFVYE
ncbi:MAG: hypothetical protein PQJ46_08310 [Spirochaetales bacterium]|nr:hypothetical protein [Spirochaetales bacterium]